MESYFHLNYLMLLVEEKRNLLLTGGICIHSCFYSLPLSTLKYSSEQNPGHREVLDTQQDREFTFESSL